MALNKEKREDIIDAIKMYLFIVGLPAVVFGIFINYKAGLAVILYLSIGSVVVYIIEKLCGFKWLFFRSKKKKNNY